MPGETFHDGPFDQALTKLLGRPCRTEAFEVLHLYACRQHDWCQASLFLRELLGRNATDPELQALQAAADAELIWYRNRPDTLAPMGDLTLSQIIARLELACGQQPDDEPALTLHRVAPGQWHATMKGVKRDAWGYTPWTSPTPGAPADAVRSILWPQPPRAPA